MAILVFEDSAVDQLAPITTTRPAFAISCGGTRLIDELLAMGAPVFTATRAALAAMVASDYPGAERWPGKLTEACLCVNGRLVPSVENMEWLKSMWEAGSASNEQNEAAFVLASNTEFLPDQVLDASSDGDERLVHYPHDIIRFHLETFAQRIDALVQGPAWREVRPGLFTEAGVQLDTSIHCDTSAGPIAISAGATIGPFVLLEGPLLIGKSARILAHAQIKDAVHVGSNCKVGGEVEASIIEPYSNKQHHGFLGHAYVGSWVNLGAGTTNSDLKNTYGRINMDYGAGKIETGMQFLGCILGDYVKTAINTSIFTGKVVGTASMLYGTVSQNVPAFVNYARDFGSETVITPDVIVTMQQRMFGRRDVQHESWHSELIQHAFTCTESARQGLTSGPPTL